MNRETLGQKIAGYVLLGAGVLNIPLGTYVVYEEIISETTAERIIPSKDGTPTSLYEFDRSGDGNIDEIQERTRVGFKPGAAITLKHTYTLGDKKFNELMGSF